MVVGSVCLAIFLLWYPSPYFEIKGAWSPLRILLGVDLVLGPVLTLILWKPGKPGLKFDMAVVAAVQLSALLYGATVLYRERPYYLVFAVDRFELVAVTEIDRSAMPDVEWLDKPWGRPVWVFAQRPDDPEALQGLLADVLFEGKPDIERRPEFWRDYSAHVQEVLAKASAMESLIDANPGIAENIDAIAERQGKDREGLGVIPVVGRERDFAYIVDLDDASPLGIVGIEAWPNSG